MRFVQAASDAASREKQHSKRRAAELDTRAKIGCHTFRATGITAYLEAGGTLENAQAWPRMKARAPPSSMTMPATRSR